MDLEQRLRASLVAPDPGATFTARVMARVGRGAASRRGRFILIGTMLVVSAAASMLAWQVFDVPPSPVGIAAIPAVSEFKSTGESPVAQANLAANETLAAAPKPAPSTAISSGYSVLVMPLRQEAQQLAGRGPVESFYAAMLDELRKVPGLTLHLPGESERRVGDQADYVLTITSLAPRVSQSGGVAVTSTDGRRTYTYDGGISAVFSGNGGTGAANGVTGRPVSRLDPEGSVFVEMKVESRRSTASRYSLPAGGENSGQTYGSGAVVGVVNLVLNNRLSGFTLDMDYGPNEAGDAGSRGVSAQPAASLLEIFPLRALPPDAAFQQRCSIPYAVRASECVTPAQLAATKVEELRLQVFPSDAAFQQGVVARLSETPLDQSGGLMTLQNLLQRLTGEGGSRLDTGTIHALVTYAAGQPAVPRMYVWNALRQVSHPALVAQLVESLRHDTDQQVRLAALAHLEANYSSDPLVRSAFERVGREDPDETVRVAVRRALYGQAQWRDEVLAVLGDTSLSYDARLAPLLGNGPAITPRQRAHRQAALQDQQVLRPLVTVIREHLRNPDHAKATSDVLLLLGSVEDPAVFDLFLQLIRETPALKQETSMQGKRLDMSGPISLWVFSHRKDPRVLASLSDVDPQLRTMIEQGNRETALDSARAVSAEPTGVPVDLNIIPSDLLERMREVTKSPASRAPITQ